MVKIHKRTEYCFWLCISMTVPVVVQLLIWQGSFSSPHRVRVPLSEPDLWKGLCVLQETKRGHLMLRLP